MQKQVFFTPQKCTIHFLGHNRSYAPETFHNDALIHFDTKKDFEECSGKVLDKYLDVKKRFFSTNTIGVSIKTLYFSFYITLIDESECVKDIDLSVTLELCQSVSIDSKQKLIIFRKESTDFIDKYYNPKNRSDILVSSAISFERSSSGKGKKSSLSDAHTARKIKSVLVPIRQGGSFAGYLPSFIGNYFPRFYPFLTYHPKKILDDDRFSCIDNER